MKRPHLLAALLALGAAAASHANPMAENVRDTTCCAIRGMLVPVCNAAICNQGKVTGDIEGRFSSKVTSIYPSGSGWLYTSFTVIELDGAKGRLETLNDGVAPRDAKGGPDLSQATEILTVTQAPDAWQDNAGTLVLAGAHALGRPTAYVGRLCRPMAAH